jgi:phosphatidylglycerophosphatase A
MAEVDPRNRPVSEAKRVAFDLLKGRLPEEEEPPPGPPLVGVRAFIAKALGSFFGVGFLPMAPGTWGSLAALLIYVPVRQLGLDEYTLGCLLLFLLFSIASLALGRDAERAAGQRDPRWFVLDEMAGVFLALYGLARYNFAFAGAAFLLFRFFDVLKIGGIGWVEKRFRGSLGILLDDLVAASFANLPIRLGLVLLLLKLGVITESP